jgi:glycosyltransferase involved in cell wall biosynthesis
MNSPSVRPWVVFADDWGRHPSSCQHLVRHVLPHRNVYWVNTIGTRPLRLDWGTVKRAAGKLRGWVRPAASGTGNTMTGWAESPRVLSPKMWPSFRSGFGKSLNRRLLRWALSPLISGLNPPPVVVTTLPLVADLVGDWPGCRWVYYCVDDFGVWPGYDGETMQLMERQLVPKVDAVIAVSETLQGHVEQLGKPAHLLTHGVDLGHWRAGASGTPPEFAGLEPPIVLFWGVIDRRMDVAFVRHLVQRFTTGSVILVGPREDPDPELLTLPRVVVRPPVPYTRLPELAAAADVLVMPYADLPATRAMQPLKLKEYLATGKPAVVRHLPATAGWADCADVCADPESFAAVVVERLRGGLPADQLAARSRLEREGWAEKARQFEQWVNGDE